MNSNNLIKNNYSVYAQNDDWKERTVKGKHETAIYAKDSHVRIWYNEQAADYAAHWHTALEIIMPVENYYEVIADSQTYHLAPGDILIIPSGELHELHAPEDGKRFIFLFDLSPFSQIKGYASIQSMSTACMFITPSRYPLIYDEIYQYLIQIRNEYFSTNEFRELAIYPHLINLYITIGRSRLNNTDMFPNARTLKQKEYMQKFNEVLDYINEHYAEDLTLDDIADFSGFSKYHFTRLFKQYTDSTFYDYLCLKRIKVAEELLAQPGLSITEISLSSGFSSISTFNRIFKQRKHCTPSEYRTLCSSANP